MARRVQAMNRLHARLAGFARAATGFVSQPEPRTIGIFARGRQLIAGNFLFAGQLIEVGPAAPILGRRRRRSRLRGRGAGLCLARRSGGRGRQRGARRWRRTGWATGSRSAAAAGAGLDAGPDRAAADPLDQPRAVPAAWAPTSALQDAFYRSLAQQTLFLGRRWQAASPGLPRFEALTGLIVAGLSLEGMEPLRRPGDGGAGRGMRPRRSTPRAASRPATPRNCSTSSRC